MPNEKSIASACHCENLRGKIQRDCRRWDPDEILTRPLKDRDQSDLAPSTQRYKHVSSKLSRRLWANQLVVANLLEGMSIKQMISGGVNVQLVRART